MQKYKHSRADRASNRSRAHSNNELVNADDHNFNPEVREEAEHLVGLFRKRGVPDKVTMHVLDIILDMAELDEAAMVVVLEQVKQFLKCEMPKPTDNAVINLTVISIMDIIIESIEEDEEDNYRKHSYNKKK